MQTESFTLRGVFTQAGFATTLGYMMYVAWDSMERDRYLAAYQGAGEIPILWSPVFLTVALVCALVALLAHKDIIKTVYRESLCWIIPLVSAGSSVTLCLQRLAQQTPNPALIATFALCIAWFVLVWAEQFGTLGGMKTLAILLVADALSALFQILCVKTMGSMALLTTTALMPIVSFLLLQQAPHPTAHDLDELGHQPAWSRTLLIGIGAFGMMYFMLRSMLYVHPYSFVNSIIVPIGSLVSLSLLAVLAWCLRAKRGFIELVIYAMLGAAMLLFLLAIILTSFVEATPAWSVLVIMSNRCGFIAFTVALAEVCVRQHVRPLTLFSIGFASLYAGYAIGGFFGVELADTTATPRGFCWDAPFWRSFASALASCGSSVQSAISPTPRRATTPFGTRSAGWFREKVAKLVRALTQAMALPQAKAARAEAVTAATVTVTTVTPLARQAPKPSTNFTSRRFLSWQASTRSHLARPKCCCSWRAVAAALIFLVRSIFRPTPPKSISSTFTKSSARTPIKRSLTW